MESSNRRLSRGRIFQLPGKVGRLPAPIEGADLTALRTPKKEQANERAS
jgi:hypothetical protein